MFRHFSICLHERFLLLAISTLIVLAVPSVIQAQDELELNLTIYLDEGQDQHFDLAEPILLHMVLRNDSGRTLHTRMDFGVEELHRYLVVTDPDGKKFVLGEETTANEPPPPIKINNMPVSPVESLAPDYVRSVTIDDIRDFVPGMKTITGVYTIEAIVPFIRYGWVIEDPSQNLFGVENYANNWVGTINSNRLQVLITLPTNVSKTNPEVAIWEGNQPVSQQVPVKWFEEALAEEDFMSAWYASGAPPEELTDINGIWQTSACVADPGTAGGYTLVAQYASEFKGAVFLGDDSQWANGCENFWRRKIVFGDIPELEQFSIFAFNSIWLRSKAQIISGHIGAPDASQGPWLHRGVEVLVGPKAKAEDGVKIYGDSIAIKRNAIVDDVYYNELSNKGTINGGQFTPLEYPNWEVPPFESYGGDLGAADDIRVKYFKTTALDPGDYRHVRIQYKGTLHLSGGIYNFKSLRLGPRAKLICDEATSIRIQERLFPGAFAEIGPAPGSDINAADIVLFIEGINGNSGNLRAYPKAAVIGVRNNINANIYVPNGTLWVREGSNLEGSCIARDVIIGVKVKVLFNSPF